MNNTHRSPPVFSLFVALSLGISVVALAGIGHAADNRVFPDGLIERYANWSPVKAYTPDNEINPLPSSSGRDILQDEAGFIWMGVWSSGLIRYDGHRMELYGTEAGLPSLLFNGLVLGPKGRLWVSTNAGIAVSDIRLNTESVTRTVEFIRKIGSVPLSTSSANSAPKSFADSIWVLEFDTRHLVRYAWREDDTLTERRYVLGDDTSPDFTAFTVAGDGSVVLGGDGRLARLNIESGAITELPCSTPCGTVGGVHTSSSGRAIVHFKDERMLVASDWDSLEDATLVARYSWTSERTSEFFNIGNEVYYIGEDGLSIFSQEMSLKRKLPSASLGTTRVSGMTIDRESNLWLGGSQGFRKLGRQRNSFSGLVEEVQSKKFSVRAFDVLDDILVAGGREGLILR